MMKLAFSIKTRKGIGNIFQFTKTYSFRHFDFLQLQHLQPYLSPIVVEFLLGINAKSIRRVNNKTEFNNFYTTKALEMVSKPSKII